MIDNNAVLDNVENAVLNVDEYRGQYHNEAGGVVTDFGHIELLKQLTGIEWSADDSKYISEFPLIAQFKHPCGIMATVETEKFFSKELIPVTFTHGNRTVTREVEHAPTLKPTESYLRHFQEAISKNTVLTESKESDNAELANDEVSATYNAENETWTVAVPIYIEN